MAINLVKSRDRTDKIGIESPSRRKSPQTHKKLHGSRKSLHLYHKTRSRPKNVTLTLAKVNVRAKIADVVLRNDNVGLVKAAGSDNSSVF